MKQCDGVLASRDILSLSEIHSLALAQNRYDRSGMSCSNNRDVECYLLINLCIVVFCAVRRYYRGLLEQNADRKVYRVKVKL